MWIQHFDFFQKPILPRALEKFSTWDQDGYSRPGPRFPRLSNQNVTSIDIRKKMGDLGEKLKTHILKISLGTHARN